MEERKSEQKGSQSSSMKEDYSYQKITNNLLSTQMENKSASIMTLALMLVHKQELLQNISHKLNKLIKSHSDQYVKIQLNEIIGDISKESDNNRDWNYFEAHLKAQNTNFIKSLLLAYPNFSSQEVRISALLKSGLSTKDIANLLSIHIRTVENHRFSIRKKMGLEPKKDLSLALQQFD